MQGEAPQNTDRLLETTPQEERYFRRLDNLGIAAEYVLYIFPPPHLAYEHLTGNIVFDPDPQPTKEFQDIPFKTLTPDQQRYIDIVYNKMMEVKYKIANISKEYTPEKIIESMWVNAVGLDVKPDFNLNDLVLVTTPLGFALLTRTVEETKKWGLVYKTEDPSKKSKSTTLGGLYLYSKDSQSPLGAITAGHCMFINATNAPRNMSNINRTIMHEYLHLINNLFVLPYEISREYRYKTTHARLGFNFVRDELLAYAYGSGIYQSNIDSLVPTSVIPEKAVNEIPEEEREIFITGLRTVFGLFKELDSLGITPPEIAHIILTSQNFLQMAKRLKLFIDKS